MSKPPLTHPYVPNIVLKALYRRAFERIQVDDGWAEEVRALSKRGSVLFVLPNLNWLDFVALDYLTKRHNLPPLQYANDLGLWFLNPRGPNVPGRGLINMLLPNKRTNPEAQLEHALNTGGSAALFLKRPPSVLDVAAGATGGRGMREGDALVHSIFKIQRSGSKPLLLMPLVFVWSKSPDKLGVKPWDVVLGPRAWPTPTRALGQFAYNRNHASLRWGSSINVSEVLEKNKNVSDEVLVRRITYMVLRRIERERRAVVGPAEKAPERIRSEIIRSPRLQKVIGDLSGDNLAKKSEKIAEASSMLKELQARPSTTVLKGMDTVLNWGFNRIYHGIEFDPADVERLREASKDGALILLPSHKSHIDYLVLSYFFYGRNLVTPVIAAGENLNFQPIGPIFRRCGAFFIRRSFKGDRLYASVVDAYIRRLIRDGFPIEIFLEGGRSRTGKLLEPKLGLLNMIVDAAIGVPQQKVHFVPVSIGYERVIEADSYQHELTGGEKKKEEAADLLNAGEVLRHRYGRISLQFGNIMTLDDIGAELNIDRAEMRRPAKRRAMVTRIGNRVMDEINRVTAVTPGALTAMALLARNASEMGERDIFDACSRLLNVLTRMGARISSTLSSSNDETRLNSIRESLQMFLDAQLLETSSSSSNEGSRGPSYRIVEGKRLQLDTSKNIIIHFFVEQGLIAAAFDRDSEGLALPTPIVALRKRVHCASKMFKHEFRFRADAPFEEIFDEKIDEMLGQGHLQKEGTNLIPGAGEAGWSGQDWLSLYHGMVSAIFEGYLLAASSLDLLLSEPRTEKELVKGGLALGHCLQRENKLSRGEAICKPVLLNAYQSFSEHGFLRTRSGKLELKEEYSSRETLDELTALFRGFLLGNHGNCL